MYYHQIGFRQMMNDDLFVIFFFIYPIYSNVYIHICILNFQTFSILHDIQNSKELYPEFLSQVTYQFTFYHFTSCIILIILWITKACY